jgi:hypothetical protein
MLGAPGAPLRITPSNVMLFLGNLQAVLKEHLHWVTSGMYLLVPVEMRPILMLSQYANQSWSGLSGPTTNITGLLSHDLNGFTVYETVHLPSTMENGSRCYYIIAGHKDAYAYAADIIGERISKTPKTWSIMYQMLAVWGGAMLFPEFVALGYVTFDAELSLT